jgi:hypothetical protein
VANPAPPLWRVVTKIAHYVGLITTFGGAVTYLLVLRRPAVPGPDRALLRRRFSVIMAIAGLWHLVAL